MRDEASGVVTLHDSSTNGTFKELQHGDEFYVVYKKENEELNVGFVYRDCVELSKAELEESGTQECSAPDLLDSTLEGFTLHEQANLRGTGVGNRAL
ncbi:hypothetical protein DPMN_122916 [Dreissena polymorpha]|uniref:Uncharacterized protein n=1 Tax=Dreissena polymorpha TaxID=45954 RepID=A0A9D4GTG8_DREPO|nr:hypothetical protein DPMN_122916 [Dreissena polymorpha]